MRRLLLLRLFRIACTRHSLAVSAGDHERIRINAKWRARIDRWIAREES